MADVKFSVGTYANYKALEAKDAGTLYFTTDTLQIFKGAKEYTKSCELVSVLPESDQIQGKIYVRTTDFTLHTWNGTEFKPLTKSYATAIPESNATDDTVPTTKAVADYVNAKVAAVAGDQKNFVSDVTYAAGKMTVTKDGKATETVLTGVVHEPTYEAETRTIKLPVFGGDELVINLGKDLVVESGKYDAKAQEIQLTLTSGDVVKIPVGSLVDIYTGAATSTATVTVSADNEISVAVKVSVKANNAITIEDDGLYVAIPDAYTKAEADKKIEDAVKVVSDAQATHEADAVKHITAEERTSWNARQTAEQVAATVAAAKTDAIKQATDAANEHSDGLNTAMDTRVKVVEAALTWQTI